LNAQVKKKGAEKKGKGRTTCEEVREGGPGEEKSKVPLQVGNRNERGKQKKKKAKPVQPTRVNKGRLLVYEGGIGSQTSHIKIRTLVIEFTTDSKDRWSKKKTFAKGGTLIEV